jgi:hypothetical protein
MGHVVVHHKTRLVIENIEGYLGKRVILVILKDEQPPS